MMRRNRIPVVINNHPKYEGEDNGVDGDGDDNDGENKEHGSTGI